MRRYDTKVYDDYVVVSGSSITVYTPGELDDLLGLCDQIAVEANVDRVGGTSPQISVTIESSNDRRNWNAKSSSIISATSISAGSTNVLNGSDDGSTPNLGYVRFAIRLTGTDPSAHVRLYATGRTKGRQPQAARVRSATGRGNGACEGCSQKGNGAARMGAGGR